MVNFTLHILATGDLGALQQPAGAVQREGVVHQKQRLLRHGRVDALRARRIGAGEIETLSWREDL